MRLELPLIACVFAAFFGTPACYADTFSFAELAIGTATDFTLSSSGLTAAFASPAEPGAFIVNASVFATLGDTVLQSPDLGAAELDVSFSAPVPYVTFAFATDDLAAPSTTLTATFYDGAIALGSVAAVGTVQPGSGFPEGVILFAAASPVTRFTLADADAPGFAIGGVTVPAPGGVACALGALAVLLRRPAGGRA